MSSFLIGQWLRKRRRPWKNGTQRIESHESKHQEKHHFSRILAPKIFHAFFLKNLEISRKAKNWSKFVYILQKQCRSHFNLTIFFRKNVKILISQIWVFKLNSFSTIFSLFQCKVERRRPKSILLEFKCFKQKGRNWRVSFQISVVSSFTKPLSRKSSWLCHQKIAFFSRIIQ